jgi:hypothetical protein
MASQSMAHVLAGHFLSPISRLPRFTAACWCQKANPSLLIHPVRSFLLVVNRSTGGCMYSIGITPPRLARFAHPRYQPPG